jgi:Recombination endonuclease VII
MTFIARFGLVQFTKHLGKRYPRDGLCEICGLTGAEVAAERWRDEIPGDYRYPHMGKLQFDHCHDHGWVRGLLCLPCNNGAENQSGHIDPKIIAYRGNCPDCRTARLIS